MIALTVGLAATAISWMGVSLAYAASVTINPNAAGSNSQWTWSGGSADFTNWQSADDDTTYAGVSSQNQSQTVALDDTSLYGTINSVTVYASARQTTGNEKLQIVLRTSSSNYVSATSGIVATSYSLYSNAWTTDPSDTQAWTWSEINGLEAGVKSINNGGWGGEMRVSQVYVVVDYTPPYISSLTASDAPNVGDSVNVNCALQNTDPSSNITNSTIDYFLFIDGNSNNTPDEGETYITSSGGSGTYTSTWETTQQTKQTTGFAVNANSSNSDSWSIANNNFPSTTTYTVYAIWKDSGGTTLDPESTTCYSIPVLGWPLLFLASLFFPFLLVRRGVLRMRPA
jgi:hypothetical protein